jgi:tRNA uridine 5-carbamoylmethylation protein Kti12
MKQVIAMRAIPGSGKSTFAKQLVSKARNSGEVAVICSSDDYFYQLGEGQYAFDPSKIADAHKYCFKKFMNAVNKRADLIIVDNTNLSAWEISPYKMYAEAHDYGFSINEVKSDVGEAFKRQQHGVPEEAHKRMSESLEKEFIPPWWDKKSVRSKTDETGNPIFEEEFSDENINRNAAFANRFNKLANYYAKKYSI